MIPLFKAKQIEAVLDRQLWSFSPKQKVESLDKAGFLKWLAAMQSYSLDFAAKRVCELDFDFLVHAFLQFVCVIDRTQARLKDLRQLDRSEFENQLIERALAADETYEFDQYILYFLDEESWYILNPLLDQMAGFHGTLFSNLCNACASVAGDWVEESGGLHKVANRFEQISLDMAGQRDERRTKSGFVSKSVANSFMASLGRDQSVLALASEHIRDFKRSEKEAEYSDGPIPFEVSELIRQLDPYRNVKPTQNIQIAGQVGESNLKDKIARLQIENPTRFQQIQLEIQFVANCAIEALQLPDERNLTAWEAMNFVYATAELGLENPMISFERDGFCDFFLSGWKVLKADYQIRVARRMAGKLRKFSGDHWMRSQAHQLGQKMRRARASLGFLKHYAYEFSLFFDYDDHSLCVCALGVIPVKRFDQSAVFFRSTDELLESA